MTRVCTNEVLRIKECVFRLEIEGEGRGDRHAVKGTDGVDGMC